MDKKYRYLAPDIEKLLRYFERGLVNPSAPSEAVDKATNQLFHAFDDLQTLKDNDEAKAIWITVPRGDITDFGSYEEIKDDEDISSYEEYEDLWKYYYPTDPMWYRVVVNQYSKEGKLRFRGVEVNDKTVLSSSYDDSYTSIGGHTRSPWTDDSTIALIELLTEGVQKSIDMLRQGTYNDFVNANLPYFFRTGVVKRSALWKAEPEEKKAIFEGLRSDVYQDFKKAIESGQNSKDHVGRMKSFTANDFFRACSIGYKACGYDVKTSNALLTPGHDDSTELSLVDQYFKFADGRDEGLTGRGSGLNAGPGIDFDDPKAWDEWYFHRSNSGGHPWEVCRGGNSTHVDLFVMNDSTDLTFKYRLKKINEDEYQKGLQNAGYYFLVAGDAWNRACEAVNFYVAIKNAGLPVLIRNGEAILRRFEGEDLVGIVPHDVIPKYCEGMFPSSYGTILDFRNVDDEDMEKYGNEITWLPEEPAALTN